MINKNWKIFLIVSILIAGILSWFASSHPDGLEKVAAQLNFLSIGTQTITGIMPDYLFPGITSSQLATSLAGTIGTIGVFLLLVGLGKLLYKTPK